MWISITGAAKVISGVARGIAADVSFLKGLIEAGKLRTVIDRRYSLDESPKPTVTPRPATRKDNVVIVLEK